MTRFRITAFILGPALLIAGCWGGVTDADPAPQVSVTSRFVVGTPSHIETVIVDPLPVETARLVTADGVVIAATEIARDKNTYTDTDDGLPHVAVGAEGGSQDRVTTGLGIQFPLFSGGDSGTPPVSLTTSTLTFMVPDRAVYAETWQRWILHVELGDGANRRTIETLPPRPPR